MHEIAACLFSDVTVHWSLMSNLCACRTDELTFFTTSTEIEGANNWQPLCTEVWNTSDSQQNKANVPQGRTSLLKFFFLPSDLFNLLNHRTRAMFGQCHYKARSKKLSKQTGQARAKVSGGRGQEQCSRRKDPPPREVHVEVIITLSARASLPLGIFLFRDFQTTK